VCHQHPLNITFVQLADRFEEQLKQHDEVAALFKRLNFKLGDTLVELLNDANELLKAARNAPDVQKAVVKFATVILSEMVCPLYNYVPELMVTFADLIDDLQEQAKHNGPLLISALERMRQFKVGGAGAPQPYGAIPWNIAEDVPYSARAGNLMSSYAALPGHNTSYHPLPFFGEVVPYSARQFPAPHTNRQKVSGISISGKLPPPQIPTTWYHPSHGNNAPPQPAPTYNIPYWPSPFKNNAPAGNFAPQLPQPQARLPGLIIPAPFRPRLPSPAWNPQDPPRFNPLD